MWFTIFDYYYCCADEYICNDIGAHIHIFIQRRKYKWRDDETLASVDDGYIPNGQLRWGEKNLTTLNYWMCQEFDSIVGRKEKKATMWIKQLYANMLRNY